MTEAKLDPLEVLKEDLQDEDYAIQIDAAKKILVIAKAIGPQRARKDLIEFLTGYLATENDEALVAIGKNLAGVAQHVGGAEHVQSLVPLLEKLSFQEETVVCEAASDSMSSIVSEMSPKTLEDTILPTVERMATAEWFQPRVGVSKVLPKVYPKVSENSREKILKWFASLCKDENPMVKKSALLNMGHFANAMAKDKIRDNVISKLKDVCTEDSDLMRLHAVSICETLTTTFDDSKDFVALIWPIVQKLGDDTSWKVRKELANAMPKFAKVVGPAMATKDILPIYLSLLNDKEPEVKIMASKKLNEMCNECKEGIASIVQVLRDFLVEDGSQIVRASVSEALGDIAALCDSKQSESLILDVMKIAVKDEDSLVRSNTLESIRKVAKTLKSAPATLLSVLQPLASDPKWRVRREYLRASTAFAVVISKGSTTDESGFDAKLTTNLIDCLSDHICSIREEACIQLAALVENKGGEWGVKKLLPEALKSVSQTEMAEQSNYITRMTGLILVQNISKHLTADQIETNVLSFIETCLKDVVENVRFKAARAAAEVIPRVSRRAVRERIIPALETVQKGEQDTDILFYSEQALQIATKHA
mmetsp:Transcript_34544/g.83566  ORF Transcript_34544/g.83566 Transcript_34544/m.83566 type:complete len:595 (-) Transcript_34544:379-2163(-)|eukprot:CAMPEP_0114517222 /NCGR_PEP_ID=MMETSP0109-20121206/17772_1 /TAXON_ID=29199 /ORGANISM="Chlorarachnion reptans, Strain CCCM449" /LENGTH=594 /DNA_ID=CAMNT_0001697715 /DNA_START=519 /DNA_END=2303 /DNA_ORIENTATION=+